MPHSPLVTSRSDTMKDAEKQESWSDIRLETEDNVEREPLFKRLLKLGVETRGIQPVPQSERTDAQFSKIFFIWFSANFTILAFSAGTLGPAVYGLGVRDACLTILFFDILCCAPPAYLSIWGPRLGMRQMIIARYSFGYFGIIIPCILNLLGLCGFSILNCILGGQTLASVNSEHLSWTVGIVVISIISLLVSFCGFKVLHWYERVCWLPTLITFVIVLGVGGKHLSSAPPSEPASARAVLNFASTLAGSAITWSPASADFGTYLRPDVSGWKIFLYSYIGLLLPIALVQSTGAAVAAAASGVPAWNEGYSGGNVGGLLEAMLRPIGGFGKFLTVLLSLSVVPNMAAAFYSFSLNVQVVFPPFVAVPRYVFSIAATAIAVPLSIVGAHRFYDTIVNFLSLIGYWVSAFVAIILLEHFVIKRNDYSLYDRSIWNDRKRLPSGLAALGAGVASFGLVIPCMDKAWFTGPIARRTGDIGFEVAFVVSALLYIPLRTLERRWRPHS
ncbi:cytosine-purine permease [Cyathus striatus]|nr:cytosine-purine permease [Cyathus striatus]